MKIIECEVLPAIEAQVIGVDIETSSVNRIGKRPIAEPYQDRIITLQVSDGETVWVLKNNFISAVPLLANPEVKKIIHNASFDWKFLKHHLAVETVNLHDSMLCERLLTAGTMAGNGLGDVLARRVGVLTDKSIREDFSLTNGHLSSEQLEYVAKDVLYLPEIWRQQLKEIGITGMGRVLAVENAIVPVVSRMELEGVEFDRALWAKYVIELEQRMNAIKQRVADYMGITYMPSLFGGIEMELNLSSRDQIKAELEAMDVFLADTKEATLVEALTVGYPAKADQFIRDILEWRGYEKMLGFDYPKYVNPITGRIHPSWNQIKADTGRFSCSDPNLQQVIKPEKGEWVNFRHLFPPKRGYKYIISDYSQQEPRILAEASGDPAMIKAANETDIYAAYGLPVYGHVAEKGSHERDQLKVAVLADAYGGGAGSLSRALGVSLEDAAKVQEKLHQAFPVARQWGSKQAQALAQRGYVTSLWGRRRYALDARGASRDDSHKFERMARNMPIQATAADIGKEAMRRFSEWSKENGYTECRIVLAVHDELVVQAPEHQAEEAKLGLEMAMLTAMEDICPNVKAGIEAGIRDLWEKV